MPFLDERAGLAGTVAAVAGGGGGLGRASALDLARAGVHLALADVDGEALTRTADEARSLGVDVVAVTADVRDADALRELFDACDERFDRLDTLVNVVGGTFRAAFGDVSAKGRDALVRANFTWIVDAVQLAAARMSARGRGGSIITITSIEAHRAAPGYAIYASMKAAVTHLTRTLAVELGGAGIRINCIAPDFIPTAGMAAIAGRAGSAGQRAAAAGDGTDPGDWLTIPLRRKGEPADVGNCVLFLASALSSYITGTTLHPDGGALAMSGWMQWPDDGFTARPPSWVLDRLEPPTS
ncbi:MAG: SDR family oxidoreductase [Acidimicrobiales bacterium]|jgi:NAD(P)-dependent dehydrogenase (short-subunit alcohol dehydrogenase family)